MARRIKVEGGILNIRIHPHPPGAYEGFIETVYALKKPIRVRGDKHAVFSLLNRREEEAGIYTGLITTFTKIDASEPWFDVSSLKEATDNQVSEISIPDDLFPNASSFNFVFDANSHRLYVQTYASGKTFSIYSALRLLDGLCKDIHIVERFGAIKITVVQSKSGLDRVLALDVIKRLTIVLEKPNADIFDDDFDEKVEAYLEELHSKKLTLVFEAEAGKSINPTPPLRRVGESALEHGSVKAVGRDGLGATERSTEDFPRKLHDKYDPDNISESDAFRRLTGQ